MSVGGVEPADCANCGSFASQALDVKTDKHGLVLSRMYYVHCFDGDCGAEGPRIENSDHSILLWNDMQAVRALKL